LTCTVTRTYLPDDAECTQASVPATRNPVSSKCATSAQMSALVIAARAGLRYPATRRAIAARVPGEACTPNSSASAWRARSRDRNCPCHKYAPIPETRGPYVLHRRGHPLRRLAGRDRPAAAAPGDQLMLGDLGFDRRYLDHPPPLHPGLLRAGQVSAALSTAPGSCRTT